jgi:hypothetical protein
MKKWKNSSIFSVAGFIKMYCKGEKLKECIRLTYLEINGEKPSEDMMPNGEFVKI